MFPDNFVYYTGVGARRFVERALFDLRPGVTEVYLHPAVDTDELRASHPDWAGRVEDHAFLCSDPSLLDLIDRAGATLIGYRDLRDLQRGRVADLRRPERRPSRDGARGALRGRDAPTNSSRPTISLTCCYGPDSQVIGDAEAAAAWL